MKNLNTVNIILQKHDILDGALYNVKIKKKQNFQLNKINWLSMINGGHLILNYEYFLFYSFKVV